MLKTKCFIIGMILSSSLQVKAFIPTNNTAICAAAAAAADNVGAATANAANKERGRDEGKEPDMVETVSWITFLLSSSALLFMCLLKIAGLFLGEDNDT